MPAHEETREENIYFETKKINFLKYKNKQLSE
jgi:hypothetical protein